MPTIDEARAWYQAADPVHDFDHVLRVYRTAERLAQIEGADLEIVRAAALLHDAQGSAPGEEGEDRASHHHQSAEFAREVLESDGWPTERIEAVLHCIRAHRFRDTSEPPRTLEAKILFDADKLDVLGAIGAARTIAYAVLDGQPVYAEPSERFRATGNLEPGEPHSSYHEYLFKLSKVKERLFTSTARQWAEARHQYLAGFYQQLAAEIRGER
ncbi:MAG TPA: HD domain-containing protein [Anaerolineaceae bacterium]|nr:HD domain-containing protein [Anaerolineaceae bacterium]